MLIGIDGNEANVKNRVGSNTYSFEVIKHLYCLQNQNDNLKFIVYLREKPLFDLPKETSWWEYRIFGPKRFWTQFALPLKLYTQKEKLDVFFTPGHYAPRFCPCPLVITILDTSYLSFPLYFKKDDLYQLRNWTGYSVKKAKRIVTISESSKKDIIKHYNYKSDNITVVYPGYSPERFDIKIKNQKSKIKEVNQRLKIEGEYLLYIGTLQPRKNIIRLIEAFSKLITQNQELGILKLVIAGKKGWLYEEIFDKVNELNLQDEVIFTGYVDESDLPYLIAGAKLYVLPSLYEGFGIPVVEAMAVGTPVVVSRVSSLPEVAGEAGIYIDNPKNVDDIARAIKKGLDLNENQRNEIIRQGLIQVNKFSWEKAGKEILSVLKR